MLVCSECFKPKGECNCNKPFIEIDDEIVDIIRILNEKGYITEFCCAGHIERRIFQCYIKFVVPYEFKTKPRYFKINMKHTIENVVYQKEWEKKTEKEKESHARKVRNSLLKWAVAL